MMIGACIAPLITTSIYAIFSIEHVIRDIRIHTNSAYRDVVEILLYYGVAIVLLLPSFVLLLKYFLELKKWKYMASLMKIYGIFNELWCYRLSVYYFSRIFEHIHFYYSPYILNECFRS